MNPLGHMADLADAVLIEWLRLGVPTGKVCPDGTEERRPISATEMKCVIARLGKDAGGGKKTLLEEARLRFKSA